MSDVLDQTEERVIPPQHDDNNTAGAYLTRQQVCDLVGLSYAQIWNLLQRKENPFPRALKIGACVRWKRSEVDAWMLSQPRMRVKGDPEPDATSERMAEAGRKGAAARVAKRKLTPGKLRDRRAGR